MHIQVQERREMKFRRCLFTVSTKHEIRHFHAKTAKKCTKKRDACAMLLIVLQIKPIVSLTFSLPSCCEFFLQNKGK